MKHNNFIRGLLISCVSLPLSIFAQAEFSGNVKNIVDKKGVSDVQIMAITGTDTVYHKPDINGNFNFTNKAGKTKIYAVGRGYVAEVNSMNTTNGSKNKLNIAMVPTDKYSTSKMARAEYSATHVNSYKVMESSVKRAACALPGIKPAAQSADMAGIGILTATEFNDFARWNFAGEMRDTYVKLTQASWGFVLDSRIPVQLSIANGTPLVDVEVKLLSHKSEILWTARTDNTGKAELWPVAFTGAPSTLLPMSIEVAYQDEVFTFPVDHNRLEIQHFVVNLPCAISDNLDIAFVVDATGSMSDEIEYVKRDLDTFIRQVAHENKDINIRLGSVFYRDRGDAYVARYSPFSSNSSVTDNFILEQSAAGGGDYPEAVTTAMEYACDSLEWSEQARARLLYLILDAGAHVEEEAKEQIRRYTAKAAAKGIRVIPVICSGLTQPDAYLMRSIALATNGTTIYLKNYNNTVNRMLTPSGDHYKIETLSELMSRITRQFSVVPDCDNRIDPQIVKITDSLLYTINPNGEQDTSYLHLTNAEWKHQVDTTSVDSSGILQIANIEHSFVTVYPNPTRDIIKIKTSANIVQMYLADVSGKILQPVPLNREGLTVLDLSRYSSGIYYLKYPTSRGWGAERVLLQRDLN